LLRDQRKPLAWLAGHLERVRQAQAALTFVYPVAGHGGRDLWYLIRRGWVAAALPTPRLPEEHRAAVALLDRVFTHPDPWTEPAGLEQIDTVLLVDAWFRKHKAEKQRTLEPAKAQARCQAAGLKAG
jgi:hypothetical protein